MWYIDAVVMTEENFRNYFRYASSNHFSMSSLGGANVTAYDWNSNNNQLFNLIASGYKVGYFKNLSDIN